MRFVIHREAGEAVAWVASSSRPERTTRCGASTPETREANEQRSRRRARSRLRRYCAGNSLNRLVTLTYRTEPADPLDVGLDLARFIRCLRRWKGCAFPYAGICGVGEQGRLHVHLALGIHVPTLLLERMWGKGHVDIRRISGRGRGAREAGRITAAYLAKHLQTSLLPRRFETGHGFGYPAVTGAASDFRHAECLIESLLGPGLTVVFESVHCPDWMGPPLVVYLAL